MPELSYNSQTQQIQQQSPNTCLKGLNTIRNDNALKNETYLFARPPKCTVNEFTKPVSLNKGNKFTYCTKTIFPLFVAALPF